MPKEPLPKKKRIYTKRSPKWFATTNHLINIDTSFLNKPPNPEDAKVFRDELDLLRDMLASFESLTEEGRFRAYAFFTNKHSRYGITF